MASGGTGMDGEGRKDETSDDRATWPREKKLAYVFEGGDAEQVFTRIFDTYLWDGGESPSGAGSMLELTENLRKGLPGLIAQFSIRSIFDAPCGDFNWMKVFLAGRSLDYLGGDIVKPLIDINNANYGDARTRFVHFDITKDDFPKADLWICRDCLFHLSIEDSLKALRRFAASEIDYILTSTHTVAPDFKNEDIVTGNFRSIDLFSPPYSFDAPLYRIDDSAEWFVPREMCLWSRAQIARALR